MCLSPSLAKSYSGFVSTTVSISFDLNSPGKQAGYLRVGDSTNHSGWATHQIPIISVKNGTGPTVLLVGGTHGDEYEGQIVAAALSRSIKAEEVTGRIIIIPCISMEASRNGNRLWSDGANFNRVFPGIESGAIHGKLAHFLSSELFPQCDGVVDMHSGGRSMYFIPSSNMTWVKDHIQRAKLIKNMLAWNTEVNMVGGEQPNTDPYSLLNRNAEAQGKSVSTGEFGGAGITTPQSIQIIREGLSNFLRSFGVLKGGVKTRDEMGRGPLSIIDFREGNRFINAPRAGIYENLVGLGAQVQRGDVVGQIHDVDHPDVPPVPVRTETNGVVSVIRGFPPVVTGDCVCVVGKKWNSTEEIE
jgi:predicted deacylase